MKCSVFIATTVDGFIATEDGNIDWLYTAGNTSADLGDQADMGFNDFINSVDCLIMGRNTMQVIAAMPSDTWAYGDRQVFVLSTSLKELPEHFKDKMSLHSGTIESLISQAESQGFKHAYVDGGKTIQSFLDLKLINEMTLTRVPIILGKGRPLFGATTQNIHLTEASSFAFANDFVQTHYHVEYR
jgi:dihydrofolate reductase